MNTTQKLIILGLLVALAGATGSARAEQPSPAPAPTKESTPTESPAPKPSKPVEQQLNGRVIAVDKAAKTITVQVNNQTYVLQTAADTKFAKAGKQKSLDDLIVGEEVTVTVALKETPSGRVEIAVVSVDIPTGTEAQGGKGSGLANLPPFVSLPNPANVGGGSSSQVRSPN